MLESSLERRTCDLKDLTSSEIEAWRSLCKNVEHLRNPFLSYTFARAARDAGFDVRVCVFRSRVAPIGFFPFQFPSSVHRHFRAAERVGGELADSCGLIAEPGFRVSAETLLRAANLATFYFTHLDEPQTTYGLRGDTSEIGLQTWISDQYWAELGGRGDFLLDLARLRRRLTERYGEIAFSFEPKSFAGALVTLLKAKRDQYLRTGVADPFADSRNTLLLHLLTERPTDDCAAVLSHLQAGDTWVATHFGLRSGERLHYWFPVYNPALAKFSPGHLLFVEVLRAAKEHGVRCIDRGSGESPAKRLFATHQHRFYRGLWHFPGLRSLMYRSACGIRWRYHALSQIVSHYRDRRAVAKPIREKMT